MSKTLRLPRELMVAADGSWTEYAKQWSASASEDPELGKWTGPYVVRLEARDDGDYDLVLADDV